MLVILIDGLARYFSDYGLLQRREYPVLHPFYSLINRFLSAKGNP
ncbi:hypothetical protein [Cerasicoccus frondis]|nr:hypothetical protein [Cerasicoccus frondis]